MTNENKIIVTLESDSNGDFHISDNSVFDNIKDAYDKLTAYDYVKHLIDASKESLNMKSESNLFKERPELASKDRQFS
jgi:predicted DNA-binding protein YlxM (UPF0122 family)